MLSLDSICVNKIMKELLAGFTSNLHSRFVLVLTEICFNIGNDTHPIMDPGFRRDIYHCTHVQQLRC